MHAQTGVKIPKYDVTEELKKVDAEFDPLLKSSEELEAFSKQRHAEIEKEIASIDEETVRSSPHVPSISSVGYKVWGRLVFTLLCPLVSFCSLVLMPSRIAFMQLVVVLHVHLIIALAGQQAYTCQGSICNGFYPLFSSFF